MRFFITTLSASEAIGPLKISFAACNFSRNLMSNGMFDKVYSILPPNVRVEDKKRIEPSDAELVYSVARRFPGRISRIISLIDENIRIFRKVPRHTSVWYYNLCMLNVVLFLLLKAFKPSVQQNVIILDFTPSNRRFSLLNFYKKLFNKADSTIVLAPFSGFKNKNSACIAGVVPQGANSTSEVKKLTADFLISGALGENISQLRSMLIPAFKEMPEFMLHISGSVDDEEELLEEIKSYKNIIYHGKLSFDKYIELLHSVTYVLSTRCPNAPENQCNFPSKVIESLLHNRAVISTIKYPQLGNIHYYHVASDIDGFMTDIKQIVSQDGALAMMYVNQGNETAGKFSPQVWKETIEKLEKNGK